MLLRMPKGLLPAVLLSAAFPPGARASEVEVTLEKPGLQPVAVSFFAAVPVPGAEPGKVRVRYGDLTHIVWDNGTLANVDAHVLVANTSLLRVPGVKVRVSIFLGQAALDGFPQEDEIRPGDPRINERLFFERTYTLDTLEIGSLGRVTVPDLQMQAAIADLVRQKLWPAYLRLQATLSEPSGEVELQRPTIQGLLTIVPPRRQAPSTRADVTSAGAASPPAGSAPPAE